MDIYIYKAIKNLDDSLKGFRFADTVKETMKIIGNVSFTEQQLENEVLIIEALANKNDTLLALQTLCDTKTVEAKTYIAGKKVTVEQLARYDEKYIMATEFKANGKYADTLKLEADLQGLTVDSLTDLILGQGSAYKEALIVFNARIEAFRVAVSKIIEAGDIDRANIIIEKANDFGVDTTDEDVAGLFA